MKRIILPTDFSDNALNGIRYAVQLFKDVETTFYLLNTYIPTIYQAEYVLHSPAQIGLGDIYQESSSSQLEELKKNLIAEFENPNHTFIVHSAYNVLVDEILKTTENEKVDLIVMATQGATGAKEILLGTNTVHTLQKSTCPIIAVPSKFEYEPPKEILFPTDYEVDYGKTSLICLLDIAQNHISSIEVIHASSGYDLTETQLKNKQNLDHRLGKIAHLFHDLPNQGVIEAINNFQIKKPMNLLVMVKNKHTFLERLFIEPIIKKIGFHVNIPFMVLPYSE
ncbi:universal stress protein [Pareuzebyella sediminis]|uniref:universal stress protein n=1 Tax=Pareuzebyella sediminis TaxID=2607998 RepID=UPI0011EEE2AD|nr:universal stress protein [Pareuzebyella sediminis]